MRTDQLHLHQHLLHNRCKLTVVLTALLALLAAGSASGLAAVGQPSEQWRDERSAPESTPVRFDLLGGAAPVAETGGFLVAARIRLEPEARLDQDHFGAAAVLSVETGSLDVILHAGTARTARGDGEPWEPTSTILAPGGIQTLHVGDWVSFDRGAALTVRNSGDQSTVLHVAAFVTAPVKL